jgi:hypothetical protein
VTSLGLLFFTEKCTFKSENLGKKPIFSFFVGTLKATEKKAGYASVPKCHGSTTLFRLEDVK